MVEFNHETMKYLDRVDAYLSKIVIKIEKEIKETWIEQKELHENFTVENYQRWLEIEKIRANLQIQLDIINNKNALHFDRFLNTYN